MLIRPLLLALLYAFRLKKSSSHLCNFSVVTTFVRLRQGYGGLRVSLLYYFLLVTRFAVNNLGTIWGVRSFDKFFAICASTIKNLHWPAAADAVLVPAVKTFPGNWQNHAPVKLKFRRNNPIVSATNNAD